MVRIREQPFGVLVWHARNHFTVMKDGENWQGELALSLLGE